MNTTASPQTAECATEPMNGVAGSMANKRYDEQHPHGRAALGAAVIPVLPGASDDEPMIKVAALGLVNAYGQVLVGYNKKRMCWDLPQGVVEPGEMPFEAAIRETEEETGLQVQDDETELVGCFKHKTVGFIYPWETHLYMANCPNAADARNMEPTKCDGYHWMHPIQIPQPRGLSLRMLMTLLGHV
jgi:8-oxo-dGTP diphosphatase